jgi:hypothetical protein
VITALLGDTDCEEIGGGFVSQPVNAATSLAFVVVGAALALWGARRRRHGLDAAGVFGLALVSAGIGSGDFHGPGSHSARLLHDGGLAAVLLFIVVHDMGWLWRWRPRAAYAVFGAGMAVVVVTFIVWPAAGTGVGLALAVAVVMAEVGLHVRGRHWIHGADARRVTAYRAAIVLATIGLALNWASRTGAPLCDPDSSWQGHAVWHLLAATAAALWAYAALSAPIPVDTPPLGRRGTGSRERQDSPRR